MAQSEQEWADRYPLKGTRTTWVSDGEQVPIYGLDTRHLVNIVNKIRRWGFNNLEGPQCMATVDQWLMDHVLPWPGLLRELVARGYRVHKHPIDYNTDKVYEAELERLAKHRKDVFVRSRPFGVRETAPSPGMTIDERRQMQEFTNSINVKLKAIHENIVDGHRELEERVTVLEKEVQGIVGEFDGYLTRHQTIKTINGRLASLENLIAYTVTHPPIKKVRARSKKRGR